jgi:hypothetical protein
MTRSQREESRNVPEKVKMAGLLDKDYWPIFLQMFKALSAGRVVERLPSKCEALSSSPDAKIKKNFQRMKGRHIF